MALSHEATIRKILTDAIKSKAADVHFSVGNVPVFRINDKLILSQDEELVNSEFMNDLVQILLNDDQKKKLKKDREIICTYDFGKNLRFKATIFYQRGMLSSTLRYIPETIPTLNSLGIDLNLSRLLQIKNGLVIISGPFGSGRSTTIAALLEEINRSRKEYIITIEDLIEHTYVNKKSIIEQREVGKDTRSFKDALDYFQEENGDILYLEKMEDPEIIPMVLEIARGSSLVFTSISANSASETIARILDSFQSLDRERIRNLLSTALKVVACQKLLPKLGGGLTTAHEILIINSSVKSTIISGDYNQINNIIQTSRKLGMISFDQSIADLVKTNIISREVAIKNAVDQKKLEAML